MEGKAEAVDRDRDSGRRSRWGMDYGLTEAEASGATYLCMCIH